ncbi:Amidohydrolase_family protein [Hexamita inflata]|uniref:Amidohydrolase family protein n=1 Tax=Hexamita inflata TaxID=28002 RepID=A0AA86THN8_9EUKA|nr:Amidohydrolase family protein [Hexamita inflata]
MLPLEQVKRPVASGFTVVRSEFMFPLSDDFENKYVRIYDGYVLSENDKIIEVGKYTAEIGERILKLNPLKIIGAKDNTIPMLKGILIPGFVKCHGHDHESPLIGLNKEAQLVEWLDKCVNPFTGFINEKQDELVAKYGVSPHLITYRKARLDDLTFGITSAMTHHCNHNKYHVHEIAQANIEAGTKMVIAVGAQDRFYDKRILDSPEVAVKRMDDYFELLKNAPRTKVVPGPDQCFSNGPELLKALKKWAVEHDTLIHIHSSEEPGTTKWFIETFKQTPVEYFESIGFLGPRSVLAHQVNCTEHDLEILQKTGAKVAHNPLANTILSSGMPPVRKMVEMGIPLAISTDGSGSADNQNMIAAARLTCQYFRGLDKKYLFKADQLIERITRIPAEIIELKAGRLQVGYFADYVIFDTSRANMTPTHIENFVENLIWAAAGNEVKYVVSCGVELVSDYKIVGTTFCPEENLKQLEVLTNDFLAFRKVSKEISDTGKRGAE